MARALDARHRERAKGHSVRNWRVLTAIAAVVLAALAGVLVWKYTDDAKNDARKPFTFVSVLVAKTRVSANTTFARALDTGLIEKADRVKDSVPPSAVIVPNSGDTTGLKRHFQNLVAGHDLVAGQTLVDEDFVQTGSVSSGVAGTLSTDESKVGKNNAQAVTVQLDDPHSVGGFLEPGDLKDDEEIAEAANLFDQPLPLTDRLFAEIKAANPNH